MKIAGRLRCGCIPTSMDEKPLGIVEPGITRKVLKKGRFPAYGFTIDELPKEAAYLIMQQLALQSPTWIIAKVYVAPNYRRQGYARRLLQFVCEVADGNGYTLRLSIQPQADRPMNMHQLRSFYQQFGFKGDVGMIREQQERGYFAPGSDAAVANGCTCPIHANYYGRGVFRTSLEVGYKIAKGCPLHGKYKATSDQSMAEPEEGMGG